MFLQWFVVALCLATSQVNAGVSHREKAQDIQPEEPTETFDCQRLQNGLYADPKKSCSDVFHVCTDGYVNTITCPKNTFFDATNEQCDNWDNVFECSGKIKTTVAQDEDSTPKTVNFKCTADGVFADMSTSCSTSYVQCVHGIAYERECSPGSYFDPDEMQCDMFDNIFVCTGIKKASTTTISPADVTEHVIEFDCSTKKDGIYLDDDTKCCNYYFVCDNRKDHKIHCPIGTYFDLENKGCDMWRRVFACSGIRRQTELPQDVTEPAPEVNFDCHGKEDGDYANPHVTCDRIYFSCSGEVATERQCADGSFFDSELLQCEDYDNVPDCTGRERRTTTTEEPHDIPVYDFDCSNKVDGNYPAGDCNNGYWSCVGGRTSETKCQSGLFYDAELMLCERKEHVPSCGGERPTQSPVLDERPKTSFPLDCATLEDGTYPHPTDQCSHSFFICDKRNPTKMECPDNLVFDPERLVCDWKKYIVACGGQPTVPPFDCSSLPDGSYADPDAKNRCSSMFYVCDDHVPTRLQCTDRRFFDPDRQLCDWKKYVVTCGGKPRDVTKRKNKKNNGEQKKAVAAVEQNAAEEGHHEVRKVVEEHVQPRKAKEHVEIRRAEDDLVAEEQHVEANEGHLENDGSNYEHA